MLKFRDVLSRWESGRLSQLEASAMLGCSERTFRRYRDQYEEAGEAGLLDKRLGKPSATAIAAEDREAMLSAYRQRHRGWTAQHFHDWGKRHYGFSWGYTWTKTQLQVSGELARAPRRGAPPRQRERAPCEGMRLHQDGSRHAWLSGQPPLDLIVTMDDATSRVYSAFLVEEEGTASTFKACVEVFGRQGLPCELYTDRGSHYFTTPEGGGKVDKEHPTQVGRALKRLGVTHIPAYSPQARGRSERMFGTLQGRLVKELALAGIDDIATANAWIERTYLPEHNRQFSQPAALPEIAFVAVRDPNDLVETLSIEAERQVGRDNTVSWEGRRLQIPDSPYRAHFVKATVKVRQYPDGAHAIFHGPRCIARFASDGAAIPTPPSMAPGSSPSRRGLAATEPAARPRRRPALTGPAPETDANMRVGTKKRAARSNKETGRSSLTAA